jgi:lysophospholipase L1-like esterase
MNSYVARWLGRIVVILMVVALVSCGTGGGSTSGNWKYVALGDSLAVGLIAQSGYVTRYAVDIKSDKDMGVSVQNLGQSGWTSTDLLNSLRNDGSVRSAVQSADVVTWDIGGNDLARAYEAFVSGSCGGSDNQQCLRDAVATFETNWDGIMSEIRSLTDPSKVIVRTMDIYNPFVAEQLAAGNFDQTEPYLDEVNAHIQNSAQQNGILWAQVHTAFNGSSGRDDPDAKGYLSFDHFHPNDTGHGAIADALRALGYAPR